MTQWKVGDKAEVVVAHDGNKVGKLAVVIGLDQANFPIFDIDEYQSGGWPRPEQFFRRLSSPTYETITINGKLYNLVPVDG